MMAVLQNERWKRSCGGRMPLKLRMLVMIALVFLAGSYRLNAQSTAQISGSVHDQTGGLIPDAQIVATQTETGVVKSTTSNAEGIFAFPALAVGHYRIEAKAAGFKSYVQQGLVLNVSQEVKMDIQLAIGTTEQVVQVTADAVQVDANSPTEQSMVERATVEGLPLNGRNPATLVKSVAGVTDTTLNVSGTDTGSNIKPADAVNPLEFAPAIHGARAGGVYFSLDGVNNTDPYTIIGGPFPHPDATGEFSVVSGTYGARYESAPGGAINVVSRSGTNKFHGSVFEFIRNGFFNARTPLDPNPDVLKRNQFGFGFGGPILHDKLFFFGSYQASPTHDNTTTTGYFPTAAMRSGTFYNASNSKTFTLPDSVDVPGVGTIYPMLSATSGSAAKFFNILPTPAATNITGKLSYDSPQVYNDQQGLLKLEYTRGSHQLFARGFYDRYTLNPQGMTSQALLAAEHQGYVMPFTNVAGGDTWTHGNWIFDTRAAYVLVQVKQPMAPEEMSYSNLGITNLSGLDGDEGIATIKGIGGGFYANVGAPMYIPRKSLEFSENVYLMKGKNQLTFGGSYRRIGINETGYAFRNPLLYYAGVSIYTLGADNLIPDAAGDLDPLADFVMGMPYLSYQTDGYFVNVHGNLFGMYGEDNYRVTDKLTLTAGVRWDPYIPYTSNNNRGITCFSSSLQQSTVFPNAYPGELFAGDPGCPKAGMPSSMAEIQPRVGLAYQFGGKQKTALRLGYGRYDMQLPLKTYVGNASSNPWDRSYMEEEPFLQLDNLYESAGVSSNPFADGFQGANYTPSKDVTFAQHQTISGFAQNFHAGYVHQWSLSIQQELTPKDSIDIAYLGTTGIHLTIGEDVNTPIYENDPVTGDAPSTSQTNEDDRRPYPNFRTIGLMTSNATSSYEGMDITFKHRSHNFTLTPAFTWSKSIDDLSQPPMAGTVNTPNTNHHFQRGLSDFDQNFDFRVTGMWNGPTLEGWNTALRNVAGSWTVTGLLTLDGGQPFSVTDSANESMTGDSLDLADRVAGEPVWVKGVLNSAAFTHNAAGTFGNSGRNSFRSPSYKDLDAALVKDFRLYANLNTTFRAEAFNLFNQANYLPPNSAYGTSGFGDSTSARPARILQFSLKLAF